MKWFFKEIREQYSNAYHEWLVWSSKYFVDWEHPAINAGIEHDILKFRVQTSSEIPDYGDNWVDVEFDMDLDFWWGIFLKFFKEHNIAIVLGFTPPSESNAWVEQKRTWIRGYYMTVLKFNWTVDMDRAQIPALKESFRVLEDKVNGKKDDE